MHIWRNIVLFFRAFFGAMRDFRHQGCMSLAASLSFFTLLSFFPMICLLLYAVGAFASRDRMWFTFLMNFFQGFIPGLGTELGEELRRIASEEIVGWLGLLAFGWFSTLVFYEVDYTVNVVFKTARTRNRWISTIMSIVALSFVELLMIASYAITQGLDVMVFYATPLRGLDTMALAVQKFLLSYVLPFISVFVTVTCLYRYLPHNRPTWGHAAVGGLVLALLWETAKHLFTTYVQDLAVLYGRMYGSLLVVVMFLLWVYYSAVLFLFSAAIVHRLEQASPNTKAD